VTKNRYANKNCNSADNLKCFYYIFYARKFGLKVLQMCFRELKTTYNINA